MSWIILAITAILLIVMLAFYFMPSYGKQILVSKVGPIKLDDMREVVASTETRPFYQGPSGSFSAFFYLNPMARTGAYTTCGTNPNQASCTDGSFAPCPCDAQTKSCSQCAHDGYTNIISIAKMANIEVMLAPDSGRQGSAQAQCTVMTQGPPTTAAGTSPIIYIETIALPPIPFQKWTMITIARDGRRFDIYFNDRIVASQKTMYMPVSDATYTGFTGIMSGSKSISGSLVLANVYNYRMSSSDVAAKYGELADTRGTPYVGTTASTMSLSDAAGMLPSYASSLTESIRLPSINLCPPGGCVNAPVVRPANPLYEWTTTYG